MNIESFEESITVMKKYTLDGVVFILTLFVFSGIIPLIIPTVLIWNHKKDKVKGISV
jgi:hypothetical protein